ncbi:MAG: thioredoxin domain-containing protein [Patescibacteria group bacterium]
MTLFNRGFSSKFKRISLWAGITVVVVGSVVLMAYIATKPANLTAASLVNPNVTHEWFTGPENAKITLVEYSDFQCPACGAYYPLIKQISEEYKSNVKFVYRHFPLRRIHKNTDITANASEAAGVQGKFWEMHSMIFEHQQDWAEKSNAEEIMIGYAKTLSLDPVRFKNDLNSQEVKDIVEADYQSGIKSQVDSTPTFFLNGQKIQNPKSLEEFKSIIDQAIAKNS